MIGITSDDQCRRRHPEHGDACHRIAGEHEQHHNLVTGREWSDEQSRAPRAEPRRRVIMASGVEVNFADFDQTELREVDLFRGCAGERRYLCSIDVSLLLHLALCARLARSRGLRPRVVAACAAHDLHEVYFRDLPTGLKDLLPDYRALESWAEASVFRRLGLGDLTEEERRQVKRVDQDALLAEATTYRHPGLWSMRAELGRGADTGDLRVLGDLLGWGNEDLWQVVRGAILEYTTDGIVWDMSGGAS